MRNKDVTSNAHHVYTRRGPALSGIGRSIAVCAIVGVTPMACAQEIDDPCLSVPECSALVERGQQMSKDGRYYHALHAYRAAYALYPVAWLHINMGRVEQKLGNFAAAKTEYEAYLRTPQKMQQTEHRERASRYLNEVEQELVMARDHATSQTGKDAQPLYKKWWLWAAIGGTIAVGAGLGLGLGLGLQTDPIPNGTQGTNHGAW